MQSRRLPPVVRLAASNGVRAPVEAYLRAGGDPEATDRRGRTFLMLAAAGGSADLCRLLLESGADPARRGVDGDDAQTLAVRNGHAAVASLLRARLAPAPRVVPAREDRDVPGAGVIETVRDEPVDDSEDDLDGLDQWEALTESPPPQDEPALRADAADLQNRISEHAPIDTDFDWSDVEIELPEAATRRDPAYGLWLDEVRNLIHFGLSWGWVTGWQIAEVAGDSGGRDDADEVEARLRLALGDAGILVEDDPALADVVDQAGSAERPVMIHNGIVDEAMAFIDHLTQSGNLYPYYMRDIKRMEAAVLRRGSWR